MEKIKKFWKELSVFGIVLICILGLYIYRLAVTADISAISSEKVISKIEDGDSFVVFTGSASSTNTVTYQTTVETYLKKNRSATIYYVNLDDVDDADNFVKSYLGEYSADLSNPHTYVFINGELTTTRDGALGYYTLDKTMNAFNEAK